ncbi:hypothetical protein [Cryobacterium sp. Y57]|uniref:hypothetical protein n=1 Tax=Cryobacterium sp. Y57 TaxID=2048287 RepID=UPI000CE53BD9|nr:hypothetical protein [Cryobacterium sp. Y57]
MPFDANTVMLWSLLALTVTMIGAIISIFVVRAVIKSAVLAALREHSSEQQSARSVGSPY